MNALTRLPLVILCMFYGTWLDKMIWDKMVVTIFSIPSLPYFHIMFGTLIFRSLINGGGGVEALMWYEANKNKSESEKHLASLTAILYAAVAHTLVFFLLNIVYYFGWQ